MVELTQDITERKQAQEVLRRYADEQAALYAVTSAAASFLDPDELLGLMSDSSIGFFTLHDRFDDFSELGDTPHRVVEFLGSWPRGRWSRILVLAKNDEVLQNKTGSNT